jgi:hypothetical protein
VTLFVNNGEWLLDCSNSIVAFATKRQTDYVGGRVPIDTGAPPPKSADALCDELVEHIFECDTCINGMEKSCSVYSALQRRIAQAGGPKKSVLIAV